MAEENQNPSNPKEAYAWAIKTGDLKSVRDFVEREKFDVNMVEEGVSKRTPLHWAADFGKVEVIQYLISKGAKVNAKDNYGITPLLAAVYESHTAAVKALLDAKADPSIKGPDGSTAKEAAEKDEIKKLFK
eukprot:TRINITY_DN15753_c0_g1_i1.p1 TRINITY_DN15753_c0_g1~~TRINITY_DN15753_c0_g1_i1.p1  ORF type:complete len:131 (-),score=55.92 TRINITY_DN15753_c0_g1_i1:134-526(-)